MGFIRRNVCPSFLWPNLPKFIPVIFVLFPCLFHVNDASLFVIKRSPQYSGYNSAGNPPPLFIDWTQPRNGGYSQNYGPPPSNGGGFGGCNPNLRRVDESGESVRLRPEIRRVKVVGATSSEEEKEKTSTSTLPACPPQYGNGRDYGPFGVGLAGLPSFLGSSERNGGGISPTGWLQGILFGGKR